MCRRKGFLVTAAAGCRSSASDEKSVQSRGSLLLLLSLPTQLLDLFPLCESTVGIQLSAGCREWGLKFEMKSFLLPQRFEDYLFVSPPPRFSTPGISFKSHEDKTEME